MKVYVINLDKDKDRLASVSAQFESLGIEFERVAGVYAKEMPCEVLRSSVASFRWWCAVGRSITQGEIGCALSHQSIYRKMISEHIDVACIFEDDVLIDDRLPSVISNVVQLLDVSQPELVLLSNHSDGKDQDGDPINGYRTKRSFGGFELRKIQRDYFAEGYIITEAAARNILRQNFPIIVPADHFGRWVRNKAIHLYHAIPSVCSQKKSDFTSGTVVGTPRLVKDLPFVKFAVHKMGRVLGRLLDWLLIGITGK